MGRRWWGSRSICFCRFYIRWLCKLSTFSDEERQWCSSARKMLQEQEVKLEQSFSTVQVSTITWISREGRCIPWRCCSCCCSSSTNGMGSIVSGKWEMTFDGLVFDGASAFLVLFSLSPGIWSAEVSIPVCVWNIFCGKMIRLVCPFFTSKMTGMAHVITIRDISTQIQITILSVVWPHCLSTYCVTLVCSRMSTACYSQAHAKKLASEITCQGCLRSTKMSCKTSDKVQQISEYTPSERELAGTYASSGNTAAPSSVAVNNRGGWTLGGSRDVYLFQKRAWDQYVGQILSGMVCSFSEIWCELPRLYLLWTTRCGTWGWFWACGWCWTVTEQIYT